jgi:nucleoside 2-deoxyribosyltransferase
MRKIYLASSWRNTNQPLAIQMLRDEGHEVYDFRNPSPDNTGFSWSEIDTDWLDWTPKYFIEALAHPIAINGFYHDKTALDWCDTCILLLPCGRSAHLEAGYAIGKGKPTLIVLDNNRFEPELMYLLADKVVSDITQMLPALSMMRTGFKESDSGSLNLLFGDYVEIEQKRYGVENEIYLYKVIGALESNGWVDVPVQTPAKETVHKESEQVVRCICCGVCETEVLNYRIKDVKKAGKEKR